VNRSLFLDYGFVSFLGDAAADDAVASVFASAPDLLVMNSGVHYARELNLSSEGTVCKYV
jgi:hypothetical protein